MMNNKYDNMTLVPIVIIIAIAAVFLSSKAYELIIKSTAKNIILSVNADYSARVKSGEEDVNIQGLLKGYQATTINMYQKHLQNFGSKYQYLSFLNKRIETNNFPTDFNFLDREEFLTTLNGLDIKNNVKTTNLQLNISGKINKITNATLVPTGLWAVYFNDKLQYSSTLLLNDEKTESFGENFYKYRFNEEKSIYVRIVYSFYENESTLKYLVFEDLINMKKK